MGWNGQDLVSEFASLLGDSTAAFKTKVEGWINDGEREICQAHNWSFLRLKGKKVMAINQEEQSLIISAPAAPSVSISAGGSLIEDAVYSVKVSFYDPLNKLEKTSEASSSVTATAVNKTVSVSSIPLSTESLFTQRRVYLKKGTGAYYLVGTIADNTTTVYSITSDTTSLIQPTDYDYFRQLDGNPFYESSNGQLQFYPVDQIRRLVDGAIDSGEPEIWADLDIGRILMYPKPNSTDELSFYYYKVPRGVYNDAASVPTIPISLKETLEAYVEYKGYKYRDRAGTVEKYNVYIQKLKASIDSIGRSTTKTVAKVRDTNGRSDGWSYN
jgi:hypothetical protein